jgi:hypothetical protein
MREVDGAARRLARRAAGLGMALAAAGCSGGENAVADAGRAESGHVDAGHFVLAPPTDASNDSSSFPDGPPLRFITSVVGFDQGTCAGWGANDLPGIVEGPPRGGGTITGSTDVVSLGGGGSIVVGFAPDAIEDGPGVDFIVFENPFLLGGDSGARYAEPGEVAVSDDGVNWTAFPCTDTTQAEPDGGWGATQCGGINPVMSNPSNSISPFDVAHAGGDQYDLADIGVKHARYVRIRNIVASEPCPDAGPKPDKNGFDLDAIAIINVATD